MFGDMVEWLESAAHGIEGHSAPFGGVTRSLVAERNASVERRKTLLLLSDVEFVEVLQEFVEKHSATGRCVPPTSSDVALVRDALLSDDALGKELKRLQGSSSLGGAEAGHERVAGWVVTFIEMLHLKKTSSSGYRLGSA